MLKKDRMLVAKLIFVPIIVSAFIGMPFALLELLGSFEAHMFVQSYAPGFIAIIYLIFFLIYFTQLVLRLVEDGLKFFSQLDKE